MKLYFLFLGLCLVSAARAQMTLTGQIRNARSETALLVNVPFDNWYYPTESQKITPAADGNFRIQLPVEKPQIVFLDVYGQRIQLYGEPGKALHLTLDAADWSGSLVFSGPLGPENEFRRKAGLTFYRLEPQTWNDSLTPPAEILAGIRTNQDRVLKSLNALKTTEPFRQMALADIQYFAASKIWDLAWTNNVWTVGKSTKFSREEWQAALVQAYESQPISNDEAVSSFHYQQIVTYFPRFLERKAATKEAFAQLAERIFNKPFPEVSVEIREKGKRFWVYKALQYGLKGHALEFALASFIDNALALGDFTYLYEAYEDFGRRFPKSLYRSHIEAIIKPYLASRANEEGGIVEAPESTQLKSLEEILKAHRGRVVYVDMWGTWCGPCRMEFPFNKALKERFKGKPVDFVYIAVEHSDQPEQKWRETIRYYNLTGRHILAGKDLEAYLKALYAPTGSFSFPSYLLIDKNGAVVTIRAERPSSAEKLFEQIEKLL